MAKVEVSGETSESTRVWAEKDGSFTADQAAGVARFKKNGAWVEVDLTLQRAADGSISPKAHPAGLTLSGAAGSGAHTLVALGSGPSQMTLGWSGALPNPVLSGTVATYPEVSPGIDLVVEVTRNGYEQSLVVKNRAALAAVPSMMQGLNLSGPDAASDGRGGLLFKDSSGKVIGRTATPYMWDATADPLIPDMHPRNRQLDMEITARSRSAGGSSDVAVSADSAWLSDPARQFPIVIDPGTVVQTTYFDTYVATGTTSDLSTWTKVAIGTQNSGTTKRLAYINFTAGAYAGAKMNWATLKLWSNVASNCSNGVYSVFGTIANADANTSWTNRPNLMDRYGNNVGQDGVGDAAFGDSIAPAAGGCTGQWLDADATALFQYAADRSWDDFTMALSPYWDDTNAYHKEFKSSESGTQPHLTLNWNDPPAISSTSTTPVTSGCVTGSNRPYITSKTPRLSAQVTDSDAAPSNVTFEWWNLGGSQIGGSTVTSVPSSTTASVDVPAGAFADGGTYSWRVKAADPAGTPASGWTTCEFTVDVTKPAVPIVTTKDGKYPSITVDNTWSHGGYGQAGVFTLTPAAGTTDLGSWVYQLDTDSQPTTVAATAAIDVTVTPSEDGVRTLTVWAKDKAGNQSDPNKYVFNVGKAGLTQPRPNANIIKTTKLAIDGDAIYTKVVFEYRRGPNAAITPIPLANLTTATGSAVTSPVRISDLGGYANWNALATLSSTGGVAQVRACLFIETNSTCAYQTQWITITVDPNGDNASTATVGPGSVNLLTGSFYTSAADVSLWGLSVGRSYSSRNPNGGLTPLGEKLTGNQQQVSTDTAGFGAANVTLTRVTDRGQGSTTDSLQLAPLAAGGNSGGPLGDSYADVGGDFGAMRLGMVAGKRYRATGWIYVPAGTGLSPTYISRGERIVAFAKTSGGSYVEFPSAQASFVDGWQQVTMDFTIPAGATEAFIRLYNGFPVGQAGNVVYWDNISLRELTAPFGPQWSGGIADSTGSTYTTLEFPTNDLAKVNTASGAPVTFGGPKTGPFFPEPGSETLTLTYKSSTNTYELSDLDGDVVEFTSQGSPPLFVANRSWTRTQDSTSYVYDLTGGRARVVRVIAPTESGVGDCAPVTPAKGCRTLDYDYATTTTATSTVFGDVVDQVRAVKLWAWNPATSAMEAIEVAHYGYDDQGRLREVWDPRISPALKTSYSYDGNNILSTITPPGVLPWQLNYTTVPGDTGLGRLANVSRAALPSGTATTTVVYQVPVAGSGAPYDLSATALAAWEAQVQVPTDAIAIFPPTQVPDGNQATGVKPSSWDRAMVTYLDANARVINTAVPGGYITTTWYDQWGNTIQELAAGNRQRALTNWAAYGASSSAQAATWLSTVPQYSPDGRRTNKEWTPSHWVTLPDGSNRVVQGLTTYTYDEGAPATGQTRDLVTSELFAAHWWDGSGEHTADARTAKTEYDWTLEQETKSIVDPAGLNYATRTGYDTRGRVVTQTTPAGGSVDTTPSTRVTVYYGATANGAYPQCGNRAEWAGLVCLTKPGGQPGSGPELPTTTTTYDRYGNPATVTESTAAGTLRTTTVTYDTAGRPLTASGSAPDLGQPLEARRSIYDTATGLHTKTQTLDASNNVTAEIVRGYDTLGRLNSYKDADSVTATTTFDILDRPVVINDGKATRTYAYDEGTERRGLATSVTDSNVGRFTGTYDADGNLISQTWPNGVNLTTSYNEIGQPVTITYTQPGCGQPDCTLYTETNTHNLHGQVRSRTSSLSNQTYGYDNAGRLTSVADTVSSQCATRIYTYNTATDRTGVTTYGPAAGTGACQTTTQASGTSWSFDNADRATNSGYTHDALGRTLTMPGADTAIPGGGQETITYHANDMARSLQQGTRTTVYTLDVIPNRFRSWTDNATGTTITKTNHYNGDGDSPSWTDEGDGTNYTRSIAGIGGITAVHTATAGELYVITNLHGDFIAGMAETGYGLTYTSEQTENGAPRNPADAGNRRYSWLGSAERAADTPGGLTLMGARLYTPGTGRFLSTDSVYGGSANPYEYCAGDGVGCSDISGQRIDCSSSYTTYRSDKTSTSSSWAGVKTTTRVRAHHFRASCKLTGRDAYDFVNSLDTIRNSAISLWVGALGAIVCGSFICAILVWGVVSIAISLLFGDHYRNWYGQQCENRGFRITASMKTTRTTDTRVYPRWMGGGTRTSTYNIYISSPPRMACA